MFWQMSRQGSDLGPGGLGGSEGGSGGLLRKRALTHSSSGTYSLYSSSSFNMYPHIFLLDPLSLSL